MSDSHASSSATPATTDPTPEQVQEIKKHLGTYVKVGGIQVGISIATVFASFLPVAGGAKIALVLLIALVNAVIVAGIMMHLKEEKKSIWNFLIFTGIFFFILFFLTTLAHTDHIFGTTHSQH